MRVGIYSILRCNLDMNCNILSVIVQNLKSSCPFFNPSQTINTLRMKHACTLIHNCNICPLPYLFSSLQIIDPLIPLLGLVTLCTMAYMSLFFRIHTHAKCAIYFIILRRTLRGCGYCRNRLKLIWYYFETPQSER